jgi:NAD(P)-dependent dehydrogenase (short-subunit alcohol dehydrogenase family)
MDFTDQVVVITGASGNLGSALAHAFRQAGAKLALIDRHADVLAQEFPGLVDKPDRLLICAADLTQVDDVETAVSEIVAHFGRIDVLAHTSRWRKR